MSRDKQGFKAGRRERHLARQASLKERKAIRKARAARFAHLPGQQPSHSARAASPVVGEHMLKPLDKMDVPRLRDLAREAGCEVRSRHRKAELVAMIQDAREAMIAASGDSAQS